MYKGSWTFHIPSPSSSVKRGHICLCEQLLWHEAEALLTWAPSPEWAPEDSSLTTKVHPEEALISSSALVLLRQGDRPLTHWNGIVSVQDQGVGRVACFWGL